MIIAIDGPAGSGKSTIAKLVAKRLGLLYIDTGAMYRAFTLKVLDKKINLKDKKAINKLINATNIKLEPYKNKSSNFPKVMLDGKNVSGKIRQKKVETHISEVAKIKQVREFMKKEQQKMAKDGVVMEGRDIGTVVLPYADKKFYLDAYLEERIKRRYLQLKGESFDVAESEVKMYVINRDRNDRTRKIAPLEIAKDAIYIDTTNLNIKAVVSKILKHIVSEGPANSLQLVRGKQRTSACR